VSRARVEHGRGSRPGRGLSLDRIVTATLELVDEQGIGAASMRAVSSRLGVRSMSLYRYVQDRDELFDAVVERIVNELADDPEVQVRPVNGWRPYLTGMAHGVRRYAPASGSGSASVPAHRETQATAIRNPLVVRCPARWGLPVRVMDVNGR
jgi:TetR/AcrR family tetracycline transcriptional repressor